MSAYLSWFPVLVLMGVTASGYALATIGMKMSSDSHSIPAIMIILLGLAGAALAEIVLLRQASLPLIYLGIIVTETVLVLGYAAWIDQGLSLHQLGGATLVVLGFALVSAHG
jgi:hypothetical protein